MANLQRAPRLCNHGNPTTCAPPDSVLFWCGWQRSLLVTASLCRAGLCDSVHWSRICRNACRIIAQLFVTTRRHSQRVDSPSLAASALRRRRLLVQSTQSTFSAAFGLPPRCRTVLNCCRFSQDCLFQNESSHFFCGSTRYGSVCRQRDSSRRQSHRRRLRGPIHVWIHRDATSCVRCS